MFSSNSGVVLPLISVIPKIKRSAAFFSSLTLPGQLWDNIESVYCGESSGIFLLYLAQACSA